MHNPAGNMAALVALANSGKLSKSDMEKLRPVLKAMKKPDQFDQERIEKAKAKRARKAEKLMKGNIL